MARATEFLQQCPTCGRDTQVRPEYLGSLLRCRHCGGEFVAQEPACDDLAGDDSSAAILKRADELLDAAQKPGIPTLRRRPR